MPDSYTRRAQSLSQSAPPKPPSGQETTRAPRRRPWEGPLIVVVSAVIVFAGLIVLSPSRPNVAEVDPADLQPGFEAYDRPSSGFAIALPDDWTVSDLGESGLLDPDGSVADKMSDETLEQFQALTAPDVRIALLAWGDDGAPGFSIITRSRARTDTVDRVKYSVESALMWSYGILDPGFQLLDVDGHDTLRFTYSVPAPPGDIHVVQYVVMRGSSLLTARFHVTSPDADYQAFDTIVNTLSTTG